MRPVGESLAVAEANRAAVRGTVVLRHYDYSNFYVYSNQVELPGGTLAAAQPAARIDMPACDAIRLVVKVKTV